MLTRRELVASLAALPLAPSIALGATPPVVRPPRLRKGDTVGIFAPAGLAADRKEIDDAAKSLESLGYRVVLAKNIDSKLGYLAGPDAARAEDFNQMVKDGDVRAMFALRGGYGCARILPLVDYAAFRASPKVVVGYSDVTALLVALTEKAGVVTFHGPVAESTFSEFTLSSLRAVVSAPDAPRVLAGSNSSKPLRQGTAEGRLLGGNLSVFTSLLGTTYFPSLDGSVLALEDVNEDPYEIDRMLTSLILSGTTKRLKGLLFGSMKARKLAPGEQPTPTWTMDEVLADRCAQMPVPAASGFPFGHTTDKWTLPLGTRVRFDATKGTLDVLEPAVC